MRVYRIITAREVMINFGVDMKRKAPSMGVNTHIYEPGKEYIHFFRYPENCDVLSKSTLFNMDKKDNWVIYMTANIPKSILEQYLGYGEYDYEGEYLYFPEYAIPYELFKPEYIVDINRTIYPEYRRDKEEFNDYVKMIRTLKRKTNSVKDFLMSHSLEDILSIKDDDRTEEQIEKDKMDEMIKCLGPLFREGD